jgi:hypothetical protein
MATPDQLQQLVSPIALYPDSLVAQILTASTYPTQVVDADQFMKQNPGLLRPAARRSSGDSGNAPPGDEGRYLEVHVPAKCRGADRASTGRSTARCGAGSRTAPAGDSDTTRAA